MLTHRLYFLKALEDQEDTNSFFALTEQRLKITQGHKFTWWDPSLLLPGDDREAEIEKHLSEATYVVPLLSPSLLAAMKDEKNREIPNIGQIQDKLFPVMLVNVPLDGTVDCLGIDARQIYCGDQPKPRSYDSLDKAYERNHFVNGFVSRLIRRVENKGVWQ